jgi:hypothetical protein
MREAPLVGTHTFLGGPLNGARQPWLVGATPIRVQSSGLAARGELQHGDQGLYRITRQYADDDEWIVELRWMGR